jgi:hypothetical protein
LNKKNRLKAVMSESIQRYALFVNIMRLRCGQSRLGSQKEVGIAANFFKNPGQV